MSQENKIVTVNAFIIIVSLVAIDIGCSLLKKRFAFFEKLEDGVPLTSL